MFELLTNCIVLKPTDKLMFSYQEWRPNAGMRGQHCTARISGLQRAAGVGEIDRAAPQRDYVRQPLVKQTDES